MIAHASGQEEPQEDRQSQVEHLEEWVRELLYKNQALRIALQTERARAEGSGSPREVDAYSTTG
jgi:hypothetical protein